MTWNFQDRQRPYIIAEVGVNHDGKLDKALELVDVAAACGADAVKFQTFTPDALVSRNAPTASYQEQQTKTTDQYTLLRNLTLPNDAWPKLKQAAEKQGLTFLSTPFDYASAVLLADLGVDALKISSGELTNTPLLEKVSSLDLPLLVSTGMGDMHEVSNAVQATKQAPSVSLFHCVSAYPAPLDQCNLRAIPRMQQEFGVPVGWSDHTVGSDSAVVAVALGAELLEKHITLNCQDPGPDHAASAEPKAFAAYVSSARNSAAVLGDGVKKRMPVEEDAAQVVRRSWHLVEAKSRGDLLKPSDVRLLRPATGMQPGNCPVGRTLAVDVPAGSALHEEDLQS